VAADPQVRHREMIVDVHNPASGLEMRLTGNPIKLVGSPNTIGPPPEKGEHNEEVYGGWLGLESERIAELVEQKII
jgi:crotonobetainyl-CoA:carnitine CoA-transferase CaiB-like acyl-CoA transferase